MPVVVFDRHINRLVMEDMMTDPKKLIREIEDDLMEFEEVIDGLLSDYLKGSAEGRVHGLREAWEILVAASRHGHNMTAAMQAIHWRMKEAENAL